MPEQEETTTNKSLHSVLTQMDAYDHQFMNWQHEFKRKENIYDEYVNKHELKVIELETALHDVESSISRILSDFEGISNSERTSSMERKKSQLLRHQEAMEQEINIPINEFAAMEMTRKVNISDDFADKEVLNLTFYRNLGIEVISNTDDSVHNMKLVSYHKPDVNNYTVNESSDDFDSAQRIWDSISP
ncbi:hypothetical protein BCR42DRAFT_428438 [Absidia repens]|uniref:Kinetochore protein Spc24 n=1 Tax=Absidia repens TaxID=90262 RepID=A0A1X2HZQ0_9FUNG|nr:hypothetical protein BCR42DRAFT_428438 [Absidia repens]